LPPQSEEPSFGSDGILDGEVLRDPLGYLDVLKPFDSDLRWIAKILDRPAIQMLHRARAIMAKYTIRRTGPHVLRNVFDPSSPTQG